MLPTQAEKGGNVELLHPAIYLTYFAILSY